jgi:hypothetical protein
MAIDPLRYLMPLSPDYSGFLIIDEHQLGKRLVAIAEIPDPKRCPDHGPGSYQEERFLPPPISADRYGLHIRRAPAPSG